MDELRWTSCVNNKQSSKPKAKVDERTTPAAVEKVGRSETTSRTQDEEERIRRRRRELLDAAGKDTGYGYAGCSSLNCKMSKLNILL